MSNVTAGQAYADLWQAAEEAQGIPRGLLAGLIDHESGWEPAAIRQEPAINDASRGLCQLLFQTAQGMGFQGGPNDLFDASINIALGARYLREQYDRAGSWAAALSSYNGGWRPDIGYGKPATRPVTVVDARSQVDGSILRTHVVQPGDFANQVYVDDVLDRARDFGYDAGNGVTGASPGTLLGLAVLGAALWRWLV